MLRRTGLIAGGLALTLLSMLWIAGERGRLLRRSTRALLREHGWRGALNGAFWHSYLYGRWTDQYIGWSIRHIFPRTRPAPGHPRWARTYHGKILRTEDARRLLTVNEPIRRDLEQIIPHTVARQLVLDGPPEIAVYECACRAARPNPCQPTQVCMIVGQPFVDFVVEHNPRTARKITTGEALALLDAEHARGHLHAAYFKDVMLNRFYAICNCCACCCGGIEAMTHCGVPMVISSGYVAAVNAIACLSCGACEDACPFGAITVSDSAVIDWEKCLGCGICETQCTGAAITLVRDARKGEPLDVRALAG